MTSVIDPRLRDRIRLAKLLVNHLSPVRRTGLELPAREWAYLQQAIERLGLVQSRGWTAAGRPAAEDVRRTADILASRIRELGPFAEMAAQAPPRASLADLVQDLAVLEEEFPRVHWDLKARTLSVVTDEIELSGVCLGPFEIRLDLRRIRSVRPYDVIALEPNPAAGDSSTPHPHVRNDDLCEGEGKAAIQSALRQGRLLDFFVLVRQVLETYNADSAYVPLGRWEGTSCPDCGTTVSDNDLSYCEACDSDVCGDCSTSCQGARCGRSLCGGCSDRCGDCGETYCSRCLSACPGCDEEYCADCLTNGRCSDCQETTDDENAETATTESEDMPEAGPALYPVGVGEARVPA